VKFAACVDSLAFDPASCAEDCLAAPEVGEQFDVHPNQITSWKAQLEGAADVLGAASRPASLLS